MCNLFSCICIERVQKVIYPLIVEGLRKQKLKITTRFYLVDDSDHFLTLEPACNLAGSNKVIVPRKIIYSPKPILTLSLTLVLTKCDQNLHPVYTESCSSVYVFIYFALYIYYK